MRIGFITYEYPPDIAQGGIATYVAQAALALKKLGHDTEIFCGSHTRNISEVIEGVQVHRCKTKDPLSFRSDIVDIFSERQGMNPFDVIESPEIHGNAYCIKKKFPQLPLVVKLHMPLYLQMSLLNFYTSSFTKLRFFIGALRRGRFRKFGQHDFLADIDYKITMMADGIVSPSESLRNIISRDWHISSSKINVIPYPFAAPQRLLQIPVEKKTGKVISFIGKLNVQKGIVNLVKVIPLVVKKHPDVLFRLIGNDSEFAAHKMSMTAYIKKELRGFEKNYVIKGGLAYEEVMQQLEETAICIFPSIWENFPLVCLEGMSAGCAIVGSKEGGMNEMLADGAGIIVNPLKIKEIAEALIELAADPEKCFAYGLKAREKVLKKYSPPEVGAKMIMNFQKAIGE